MLLFIIILDTRYILQNSEASENGSIWNQVLLEAEVIMYCCMFL